MIGRDFAKDSTTPGRALIQFNDYFAYLEGASATVLRPGQSPLAGRYDADSGHFSPGSGRPTQARKRISRPPPGWTLTDGSDRPGTWECPPRPLATTVEHVTQSWGTGAS